MVVPYYDLEEDHLPAKVIVTSDAQRGHANRHWADIILKVNERGDVHVLKARGDIRILIEGRDVAVTGVTEEVS